MRAILTVVLGMSLALPVLADHYRADDGRSYRNRPQRRDDARRWRRQQRFASARMARWMCRVRKAG